MSPQMPDARARRAVRDPSLADAIIPLVAMVVLIGGSLLIFGLDALDGPIQVALIGACLVAASIALKNGHPWNDVQAAGQSAMGSITSAVFILLSVGALIGTWNLSGTIPTLVAYGLEVLHRRSSIRRRRWSVVSWRCPSAAPGRRQERSASGSSASRRCWGCPRRSRRVR